MKGLILKDIYSVRFQILLALGIMLLPNIASVFIDFLGGSAITSDAQIIMVLFFYGMLDYICISLLSSFVLNTIGDDVNSGWSRIVRTFPVRGSEIVRAKITATGIIVGILTAVSLVFNVLRGIMQGVPMEPVVTMPLCMGLLQIALLSPVFPLAMRLGTKATTVLYVIMLLLMTAGSAVLIVASLSAGTAILRVVFYCGSPIAAVGSAALSSRFGNRAMNRIEE